MPAVALLLWPIIAIGIFFALGPARGLIWTLLVGFLFLPENYGFDLPGLPSYEKNTAIPLSMLLGILVIQSREKVLIELVDPFVRNIISLLIIVLFIGMIITVLDNTYPIVRGGRFQSGHDLRGMVNFLSQTLIALLPFFLARRWLADPQVQIDLLKAIVLLALLYSLAVLFERRMSPQLNRWVYGLQSDAWRQHVRDGGFRPMVFLDHGLVIGYYYMTAVLAAVGLARGSEGPTRVFWIAAAIWLFLVLMVTRNTAAFLLTVLFAPALAVFSRRMVLWTTTAVAVLFMTYPMAQQAHLIPNDSIVRMAGMISDSRAQSIAFRFGNEDGLLQRAAEKPYFGWGGWGRSRVVDEIGRDVSTPDGVWIIRLGQFGWFGYISYFGLLTFPLVLLWRRKEIPPAVLALVMMTSANMVYLLPNSTLGMLAWLLSGATVGFLQYARLSSDSVSPDTAPGETPTQRKPVYSRFPTNTGTKAYSRDLGS